MTPREEVALIERAGGSAQRFFVAWRSIQPDGPGTLSNLKQADSIYRELVEVGLQPVIGVLGAPVWAACKRLELLCRSRVGQQQRNAPPRWDFVWAYASVVRALAERYPNAVIETWNEPNYTTYWDVHGFPDPARMARMQCAAYDAVKGLRPTQLVSSPGFLWIYGYRSSDGRGAGLLEYLQAMYAHMGRVCWDVFAVHLYPGSRYDGPDSGPAQLLRLLRNLRPRHDDDTPIWIGELGATTSGDGSGSHERFSEAEQAAIVDGAVGELLAAPDVDAVFVHALRDRFSEGQQWAASSYGFGLLYEAPGPFPPPKDAYCALVARAGLAYPGC